MKYHELSRHIHELRNQTCGRAIGCGMQFAEVWSAATKCPKLDFVHYEGKQSAYSSRLIKRD